MEIRVSGEDLKRVLWIASAVLSAIGFLLMLYGIIGGFSLNRTQDFHAIIFPATIIAGGIAMAVVPWCLAGSVSKLLETMSEDEGSQSG